MPVLAAIAVMPKRSEHEATGLTPPGDVRTWAMVDTASDIAKPTLLTHRVGELREGFLCGAKRRDWHIADMNRGPFPPLLGNSRHH